MTVARKHSSGKKPWTGLCFESPTLLQVVSEACLAYTAPLMSHKDRKLFFLLTEHRPASMTRNISLVVTVSAISCPSSLVMCDTLM